LICSIYEVQLLSSFLFKNAKSLKSPGSVHPNSKITKALPKCRVKQDTANPTVLAPLPFMALVQTGEVFLSKLILQPATGKFYQDGFAMGIGS
jgi:hypothetical protein